MTIGNCPVCGAEMRVGTDMTNADRIRSMTDEELAIWLANPARKKDMFPDLPYDIAPSYVHWLVWLKKEVEE